MMLCRMLSRGSQNTTTTQGPLSRLVGICPLPDCVDQHLLLELGATFEHSCVSLFRSSRVVTICSLLRILIVFDGYRGKRG